ncbi:low affinity immunoglobulin gamma Fc region receptor II-b-like protein [Lates japonicus]|nr:low affinity immunoglobulin gamma Fc region receptor II-b-like protein [Lates japonicus]
MEVTTLCFRLMVNVLLLLTAQAQKSDRVFLRIEPNSQQFFDYEPISLKCEGTHSPAEWKVMRRITSDITECESSTGSLDIPAAFVSHSGEYWCENAEGERSNTVNISVTAPHTETRPSETLSTSSDQPCHVYLILRTVFTILMVALLLLLVGLLHLVNVLLLLTAQAQKSDRVFLRIEPNKLQFFEYDSISLKCEGTHSPAEWKVMRRITSDITECESSTGSLDIPAAFVSHSGEYWCENAEGERSNTVNISVTGTQTPSGSPDSVQFFIPLLVVLTAVCVAMLLLVVGLLHCRKQRVACFSSEVPTPGSDPVYEHVSAADPPMATYANVTKHKKKRVMNVMVVHVHLSYSHRAVFPQVVPNRLQFFEYESIVISCEGLEGLSGWRVMRKLMGVSTICASSWETYTEACTIKNAFAAESGEYWCEAAGRRTGDAVNITVTVINVSLVLIEHIHCSYSQRAVVGFPLVVPNTQQLFEYEPITVSCEGLEGLTGWRVMKKIMGVNTICASTWEDSTRPCSIKTAFSADSGEYWCEAGGRRTNVVNITVTVSSPDEPDKHRSARGFLLLWIIGTVLLMTLMFLLLGLLHYQRLKVKTSSSRSSFHPSSPPQPVSVQGSVSTQYTAITKEKGTSSHSVTPAVNPPLTEEDPLYYSIE